MEGVEVNSTPSIRHSEEILYFWKSRKPWTDRSVGRCIHLGFRLFEGIFSGWSMGGVEVYPTPSLLHPEETPF
jgi:hypothetical protein